MPHDATRSELNLSLDFGGDHRTAASADVGRGGGVDGELESALTFQALASIRGMGRASLAALYDTYQPFSSVWAAGPDAVRDVLRQAKNRQADAVLHRLWLDRDGALAQASDRLEEQRRSGITLLFRHEAGYPRSLHDLRDAPRWLFVMGDCGVLHRQATVAVVGTRSPTLRGRAAARIAGATLAEAGFVVVSGLAEGIDQDVHAAVLESHGDAVAVLGNGFSVEFPSGSNVLRQRIVDGGGAVVTEHLPSESYSKRSFIERNRIQAALASAVIPVQGALKSGTAHTVRYAQELGRRLIGVWPERPGPTVENEMLDLLVEAHATIFDIGQPSGVHALLQALLPFAADARPPAHDPILVARREYGSVLRALREALSTRRPAEIELRWLEIEISRLISAAVSAHSERGGE